MTELHVAGFTLGCVAGIASPDRGAPSCPFAVGTLPSTWRSPWKASLVAWVFMKLRKEHPLIRLVAVVGVIWLGILAGLSATDFIARGW